MCVLRIWCHIKKTSPTQELFWLEEGPVDKRKVEHILTCVGDVCIIQAKATEQYFRVGSYYAGDSNFPVCGWNNSMTS